MNTARRDSLCRLWNSNSRALAFGGDTGSGRVNNREEYSGYTWAAGGKLNTASRSFTS
jgi:hypothetical protein